MVNLRLNHTQMQVLQGRNFGSGPNGQEVHLYDLAAADGLRMSVCTYGAAIVSLQVPDASGQLLDVVLGFDHAE